MFAIRLVKHLTIMASNVSRGAAAKARSKKLLLKCGYTVWDMEINRIVYTPNGPVPTKRDQLGADLGAMGDEGVFFVQVKSGGKPTSTLLAEAQKAFDQHRFTNDVRCYLHVWRFGARVPEVLRCK